MSSKVQGAVKWLCVCQRWKTKQGHR